MNVIIRKIYRRQDIENISKKILMLGNSTKLTVAIFLNYRLFSTVVLTICLLYFSSVNYLLVPIIVVIYYIGFSYIFINRPLSIRRKTIDYEALYFFEVLSVTLESGRNLENALQLTVSNVNSSLSSEFKNVLEEIKLGKSMMEALEDMKRRIPSDTVNNIIMSMMQTSIFGNDIVDTMNTQVDYLREKQMLSIKEQINKIPNKISIISVIFIVPLILLMILGPFIVDLIG